MQLITNHKENHKEEIFSLFKSADEIIIAVAFLKYSGLKILLGRIKQILKEGGRVQVFCGLSFFQTDPSAIRELMKLDEKNQGFTLKVIEPHHGTFHPKIYYAKKGKKIEVIIGSANLTSGGLQDNDELSILNHGDVKSDLNLEILNYFNFLLSKSYPIFLDETLEKYEKKFKLYKRDNKKQDKQSNEDLIQLPDFTTDNNRRIANHLGLYRMLSKLSIDEFNSRINNYTAAKKLISRISKGGQSKSEFEEQYSELLSLFFSSGLQRSKGEVVSRYKKVIDLFANITSSQKPDLVQDSMKLASRIPGLGINLLTEVLHATDNSKYPIINNRSIGALMHLGFDIKKYPNNYSYKDYLFFEKITKNIITEHNLENFSRLDHLLHAIHTWNRITEGFDSRIPDGSNVFIKPVGYTGNPFPERPFDLGISHVDFTNKARYDSIKPGDILIIYGVGTTKIISIAVAMTELWQRLPYDVENPPEDRVWPKSVWIQNLTPNYGQSWWIRNYEIGVLERDYLKNDPNGFITAVGGQSLGALKRGADKIELDRNFGLYLIDQVFSIEFSLR